MKILFYLLTIQFRKLLSKGDTLGIVLLILFHIGTAILVFLNYEKSENYKYLLFLEPILLHLNRNDFELLKIRKNYKLLIFIEYLIYCLPIYIVLILKREFFTTISILVFYALFITIPKINFKVLKYPFQLFNVFWHISFRKYKLILLLPIIIGLIIISEIYKNENLIYFAVLILVIIACIPSFERENLEEIKINPFNAKKYFFYQFKNSIINTSYLLIPVLITLFALLKFEMALISFSIILIPLINILLKYVYFFNPLTHQISFIIFLALSFSMFGVPILLLPFIYKKAINNLNSIKYANY